MHILLSQTKDLVKKEKHFTYLILKNLQKIEENKLYCDLGYSSLHAYLERELGYSSAESALRVANVKLMKSSSLAFDKIKSGEINLTQGGTLFQALSKSEVSDKPQKMEEVLPLIVGKSTRESDKIIKAIFEINTPLQEKIILNPRLKEKLGRLKKVYGERSFEEMIEILVDEKLLDQSTPMNTTPSQRAVKDHVLSEGLSTGKSVTPSPCKGVENPKGRYIPVSLRRSVVVRAQKRCEYVSANGIRCGERRNLEFEHVWPYSKGGGHTLVNLKLYCRNHNQRQGILKIRGYLQRRRNSLATDLSIRR